MRKKKLSFLYDDDGETYIRIKDLQYVMDGAREHYIKSKRADAHKACERGLFEDCLKSIIDRLDKMQDQIDKLSEKPTSSEVVSKTENTTMVSAENAQTIEHGEDYYREHLNLIRRAMIRENGYEEQKKLNKLYWKVCDKYIEALISEFGGEE